MDSKNQNQSETLNRINTPADEKENKTNNKRLYGQLLIILIIMVIVYEYYIYTYQVMWRTCTSK